MLVLALSVVLTAAPATSEAPAPSSVPPSGAFAEWNERRTSVNRGGMFVLSGWAAANLVGGALGAGLARDEQGRWFHLGNLVWNVVNAALGVIGLVTNWTAKDVSAKEGLVGSQRLITVFLLNAGLDAGYLATAAFLWQRGDATGDPRLVGMGQALLVQGGFLLAFDLVMGLLNVHQANKVLDLVTIELTPAGVRGTF
jgi:hypothetical protein